MKTPKKYNESIKRGMITKEILGDCIYSCNKRAKNARDKIRYYRRNPYRAGIRYYDVIEKYENDKEKYYGMKEKLLSILTPKCIHKECINGEYNYYLFYDFGYNHTFHTPIKYMDMKEKYKELDVLKIDTLMTEGASIDNLVSVQFVNKVINLIYSGDYELIF